MSVTGNTCPPCKAELCVCVCVCVCVCAVTGAWPCHVYSARLAFLIPQEFPQNTQTDRQIDKQTQTLFLSLSLSCPTCQPCCSTHLNTVALVALLPLQTLILIPEHPHPTSCALPCSMESHVVVTVVWGLPTGDHRSRLARVSSSVRVSDQPFSSYTTWLQWGNERQTEFICKEVVKKDQEKY